MIEFFYFCFSFCALASSFGVVVDARLSEPALSLSGSGRWILESPVADKKPESHHDWLSVIIPFESARDNVDDGDRSNPSRSRHLEYNGNSYYGDDSTDDAFKTYNTIYNVVTAANSAKNTAEEKTETFYDMFYTAPSSWSSEEW
eukprot:CAMPEP_0113322258 /NCGR_PEP_ID=MMETSP0010_2-20120614/15484_1 /TAXON_ID=216773 ORGANISM="Corethron hystrix, Strain 308" /NCGR_SAMPLE_ID=MMETSP0010_2 /ASSEMBLY_ACC=CAM_ASM_000155 /LENGTH=144 /DNA_ID=CAMNT_0000180695 /DNA_START=194 /DNA_END=625 /DNA_ORIENTATION=- /assembly_acc=CAM_ASM_000155